MAREGVLVEEVRIGGNNRDVYYVDENGLVAKKDGEFSGATPEGVKRICRDCYIFPWVKNLLLQVGFSDRGLWWCFDAPLNQKSVAYIPNWVGQKMTDIERQIKLSGDARKRSKSSELRRKELQSFLPPEIISVCLNDADWFETGFSIPVLMRTDLTFEQQKHIAKTKWKTVYRYIQLSLDTFANGRNKKLAQIFPFCKLTRYVVTRHNEVLFTFELMGVIA